MTVGLQPAVISFSALTWGRVQLVDVNPYFQLCDGCTLVEQTYRTDTTAAYVRMLIVVLNVVAFYVCYVTAKYL